MSPSKRGLLIAVCSLSLLNCGGGGGGSAPSAPDAVPSLIGATFVGAGLTPAPGDRLRLLLSEDISFAPGALLTDLDVTLSSGGLGAITAAPILKNARTLEVTLGAGVAFTPDVTTMDFRVDQDVVRDPTGNLAIPQTTRVITTGDGTDPSISSLTLSGVDSTLNGYGSAGGTLQVPVNWFTIDVDYSDTGSGVDASRTIIVSNVIVAVGGTPRQPGLDLADALTRTSTASSSSFLVPAAVTFPEGSFELTVYVLDGSGMVSAAKRFSALARLPHDVLRPFETIVNPSQVWFIDTSRDLESYSVNVLNFITPLQVVSGANGRSDLEDVLLGLGLLSATPIPNVSGSKNSNEMVMDAFEVQVLANLDSLYLGANVAFTFDRPGTWPGGSTVGYNNAAFSQIALAGAENATGVSGVLGIALFDPNNTTQEDDTQIAFAGSQRLGVFMHTIVNDGLIAHPTSVFRVTFDPFTTARFGTPIGDAANDAQRLTLALTDGRTTDIANAIDRLARFAAVILAHECGHSVGLVANGAMPVGLYGDRAATFPVFPSSAADGHIKMPSSLYPGVSENVMSPAFDFDSTLAPETQFNSLNRAYLRERIVVNGN